MSFALSAGKAYLSLIAVPVNASFVYQPLKLHFLSAEVTVAISKVGFVPSLLSFSSCCAGRRTPSGTSVPTQR